MGYLSRRSSQELREKIDASRCINTLQDIAEGNIVESKLHTEIKQFLKEVSEYPEFQERCKKLEKSLRAKSGEGLMGRIKAIQILLDKRLPTLSSVEHTEVPAEEMSEEEMLKRLQEKINNNPQLAQIIPLRRV